MIQRALAEFLRVAGRWQISSSHCMKSEERLVISECILLFFFYRDLYFLLLTEVGPLGAPQTLAWH
jgi:hypothetical protein